jgi:hypothetical protein
MIMHRIQSSSLTFKGIYHVVDAPGNNPGAVLSEFSALNSNYERCSSFRSRLGDYLERIDTPQVHDVQRDKGGQEKLLVRTFAGIGLVAIIGKSMDDLLAFIQSDCLSQNIPLQESDERSLFEEAFLKAYLEEGHPLIRLSIKLPEFMQNKPSLAEQN